MSELSNEQIAALRVDYTLKEFDESHVLANPIEQFKIWFKEALDAQINEPNAMTLSTISTDGIPDSRIVLLKGVTDNGFTFFTNYNSNKAKQMEHNPNVSLVFAWLELQRQVRVIGIVNKLSDEENDLYFSSRPIQSQLGAIASPQSEKIESREVLEKNFQKADELYRQNGKVERPKHWGGYFVEAKKIEFWQGRSSRLHDRLVFKHDEGRWIRYRLAP
ncbi:MAG: pyridoxamine 5'-phosphate oxidase [Bacteroidia bacterium]|jgi:pyridoxamine 5'-phosphate oxidase|nr:pyridoxamine 5'-phosphate oxidase [Bacteroidia bacterium]